MLQKSTTSEDLLTMLATSKWKNTAHYWKQYSSISMAKYMQ